MAPLPIPPSALRERVGAVTFPEGSPHDRAVRRATWWDDDPVEAYLRQGQHLVDLLCGHLPADLELRGARVLDFGCGAGRVLRHLVEPVGDAGELHGVDIDRPSIEWLEANASPPLHPRTCDEEPGLPYPDGTFDLVYAYSVFTHTVEHWAGWLLELRRVLKPAGVLFATVIARQTALEFGLDAPADAGPGMYSHSIGNAWDAGGPVVVHDAAWLFERWGRAFDVVHHPRATGEPWPHDIVICRSLGSDVGVDDLLAPGSDGEAAGRSHQAQLELLRTHALRTRGDHQHHVATGLEEIRQNRARLAARDYADS